MDTELNLLNLEMKGDERYGPCYVLIDWDIDGKSEKKWETRATLRLRWGAHIADQALYDSATIAEARFSKFVLGKELERSRSPSVGLAAETARTFRNQSLGGSPAPTARSSPARAGRSSSARAGRLSPARAGRRSPVADQAIDEDSAFEKFKEDYFMMMGVSDFCELSP